MTSIGSKSLVGRALKLLIRANTLDELFRIILVDGKEVVVGDIAINAKTVAQARIAVATLHIARHILALTKAGVANRVAELKIVRVIVASGHEVPFVLPMMHNAIYPSFVNEVTMIHGFPADPTDKIELELPTSLDFTVEMEPLASHAAFSPDIQAWVNAEIRNDVWFRIGLRGQSFYNPNATELKESSKSRTVLMDWGGRSAITNIHDEGDTEEGMQLDDHNLGLDLVWRLYFSNISDATMFKLRWCG